MYVFIPDVQCKLEPLVHWLRIIMRSKQIPTIKFIGDTKAQNTRISFVRILAQSSGQMDSWEYIEATRYWRNDVKQDDIPHHHIRLQENLNDDRNVYTRILVSYVIFIARLTTYIRIAPGWLLGLRYHLIATKESDNYFFLNSKTDKGSVLTHFIVQNISVHCNIVDLSSGSFFCIQKIIFALFLLSFGSAFFYH